MRTRELNEATRELEARQGVIVAREMFSDEIGWCHQCGTLQLLADAPTLAVPWHRASGPVPCCVNCRIYEPWELGVWKVENTNLRSCAAGQHETWDPSRCESCEAA